MSKMSESQRQYFLQRVGDQVHSAKRVLELKESRKKEQMIEKMSEMLQRYPTLLTRRQQCLKMVKHIQNMLKHV